MSEPELYSHGIAADESFSNATGQRAKKTGLESLETKGRGHFLTVARNHTMQSSMELASGRAIESIISMVGPR